MHQPPGAGTVAADDAEEEEEEGSAVRSAGNDIEHYSPFSETAVDVDVDVDVVTLQHLALSSSSSQSQLGLGLNRTMASICSPTIHKYKKFYVLLDRFLKIL